MGVTDVDVSPVDTFSLALVIIFSQNLGKSRAEIQKAYRERLIATRGEKYR